MRNLLFLIILILPFSLISQIRPFGEKMFFTGSERIFFDVFSFPTNDTSKSKIDVFVKLPYDFLIFTRDPSRTQKDFIGSFDITVEIFDKNNKFIDRKIKQEIIEVTEEEKRLLKEKFYKTFFSFHINPGEYNISIELNDRESTKSFKKEFKAFRAKNYNKEKISDLSFILISNNDTDQVNKLNGIIPFGENCILHTEIFNYDSTKDKYKLKISKIINRVKLPYSETIIPTKYFQKQDTTNIYILNYPLKTDSFEVAKYLIEIENTTNNDKASKETEVVWYNMPFSLRNFDIALKQLKLILPEKEFNEISSGNKVKQREKFLEFWKKKDPTPNTLYNELMTEFYRRVDFAIVNFGTITIPDGSETDRGKTYIIYGKPDNTERRLIPGEEPIEIWTYKRISKRMIFIDENRNGNYKLKSIENL